MGRGPLAWSEKGKGISRGEEIIPTGLMAKILFVEIRDGRERELMASLLKKKVGRVACDLCVFDNKFNI